MQKKIPSRIAIGVIIVMVLILMDTVLDKTYHPLPDGIRYLSRMAITFAGILLICILYSRQSAITVFGEVFSYGFRTTAVIAFLMAVYTFIIFKIIHPVPSPAEMQAAIQSIEHQGNVLHNEAVQQATKAAANRWIIYVSISIFVSLIPGLLGSLAGAAVTKRISNFNQKEQPDGSLDCNTTY